MTDEPPPDRESEDGGALALTPKERTIVLLALWNDSREYLARISEHQGADRAALMSMMDHVDALRSIVRKVGGDPDAFAFGASGP